MSEGANAFQATAEEALQRLSFLQNAIQLYATTLPTLSAQLGGEFLAQAHANSIQVPESVSQALCPRCGTLILPGINCRVRIRHIKVKQGQLQSSESTAKLKKIKKKGQKPKRMRDLRVKEAVDVPGGCTAHSICLVCGYRQAIPIADVRSTNRRPPMEATMTKSPADVPASRSPQADPPKTAAGKAVKPPVPPNVPTTKLAKVTAPSKSKSPLPAAAPKAAVEKKSEKSKKKNTLRNLLSKQKQNDDASKPLSLNEFLSTL